ncbi:hypothetical protein MCACPph1_CDS0033 [Moorella phage MCACPph1]
MPFRAPYLPCIASIPRLGINVLAAHFRPS